MDPDWSDERARIRWVTEILADPERAKPKTNAGPAYDFQRAYAGQPEIELHAEGGIVIWADGLHVDPDGIVAAEAKHVSKPERSPHIGRMPYGQKENDRRFDNEVDRYTAVIRDPSNPVGRLRIITNDREAADYLAARARRVMGDDQHHLEIRVEDRGRDRPSPGREPIGLAEARSRLAGREQDTGRAEGSEQELRAREVRRRNAGKLRQAERQASRGDDTDRDRGR
jgi:hypothetical protein